jgi:hypothetical protein
LSYFHLLSCSEYAENKNTLYGRWLRVLGEKNGSKMFNSGDIVLGMVPNEGNFHCGSTGPKIIHNGA